MKQWENSFNEHWRENRKSLPHLELKKSEIIKEFQTNNPNANLEQLEEYLKSHGIGIGLSLREKQLFLKNQIALVQTMKVHYVEKMEDQFSNSSQLSLKLNELSSLESTLQSQLSEFLSEYKRIFNEKS